MTLKDIRKLASTKGASIATERNDFGWSYWLLDKDGNNFWPSDNFFVSKKHLADEIKNLPDV